MADGDKIIGVDILLKANTGTPESPEYTTVAGQKDLKLNNTKNVIDTTSKDNSGWTSKAHGFKSWSVDCDAVFVESDDAAAALLSAYENDTDILVEVYFPDGSTKTGNAVIADTSLSAPLDDAATYSFKLEGNGALTTVTATVTTPTLTNPTANDTDIAVTDTFTTAAFAVSSGSDTHAKSQWQVTTNADTTFATPIFDSTSTVNKTSVVMPTGLLSAATTYRVRVRHYGTTNGWSAWSTVHAFTTAS